MIEFVEARAFTAVLNDYLGDDEFRALQVELSANPEAGDVMEGTGGFRKLRWGDKRRGKGKRGGLRIIYYWFDERGRIWLLSIYDKDELADLTPAQKRALKEAIDQEKKGLLVGRRRKQ